MRAVVDKLREIATSLGGDESSDGLFLCCLSDAIEHGDVMEELDGKALFVIPAEPTDEMSNAGKDAWVAERLKSETPSRANSAAIACFKAMLAATSTTKR